MQTRFQIGETQSWMIGAALALTMHGFGVAALAGGERRSASFNAAAVPISVELGAESVMESEQSDVAPGERQQHAWPLQQQERAPTAEAPAAPQGELAMTQPVQRAQDASVRDAAPAPDTTAPQTEARTPLAHRRTATYEQILLAHLERNKRYPRAARSHRQEGVVFVQFQMDRQGRVLSSRLARGSGHDLLDEEVIALLARAQPLPAPPHTISGSVLEMTVPVEFHLR